MCTYHKVKPISFRVSIFFHVMFSRLSMLSSFSVADLSSKQDDEKQTAQKIWL